MSEVLIILLSVSLISILCIGLPIFIYRKKYVKIPRETQWKISDKDILLLIDKQIDGYLTPQNLADESDLTLTEAKSRLSSLSQSFAITGKHAGIKKVYFKLKEPIDKRQCPHLSSNPFLTTGDLLILFKHHNFELTLQKICIDTGLPVNIIKKELKRFVKEKIITRLSDYLLNVSYVLNEPYRSSPHKVNEKEVFLDLDLSKIYQKEMKSK